MPNASKKHTAIPRYSQFLDVQQKNWRRRSCGVVALKMLIDYWANGNLTTRPTISELIKNGRRVSAFDSTTGWKHGGLVRLARRYTFQAKNFDWADESSVRAFKKLKVLVQKFPVIASVYRNLKPKSTGHLVVITKTTPSHVEYHDPDSRSRSQIKRRASKKTFLAGWKHRIIVIQPRLRNSGKSVH